MDNRMKRLFTALLLLIGYGTLCAQQDVALDSWVDKTVAQNKDTVTIFLSIKNELLYDITGLEVSLQLPNDLLFLEANTPSSTTYDAVSQNWNIGNALQSNVDSLVLALKVQVLGKGIFLVPAEVTALDGPDGDSVPNNNDYSEDDWTSVCFSVPVDIFTLNQDTIWVASPANLTGHEW